MSKLPNTIKKAVCILLINKDGEVLAISRGEDTTQWGLPGGKVELGESLANAVIRETWEETGYEIADPVPVYTGHSPGKVDYMTTTFTATVARAAKGAPQSDPFEGHLKWVMPDALVHSSPFGEYNARLFSALGIPYVS
mgnify:CR=1 FL=1